MGIPLIELANGVVNGSNTAFTTTSPYLRGSIVVFLNGQAKIATEDDGWTEGGSNKIRLKVAPESGDVVQIYYVPV